MRTRLPKGLFEFALIALIVLGISRHASALDQTTIDCFKARVSEIMTVPKDADQQIIIENTMNLNPRYIKAVENVFVSVNSKVRGYLTIPNELHVRIAPSADNSDAGRENGKNILNLAYRFKQGEKLFSFDQTRATVAHEYGHTLLGEFLRPRPESGWHRIGELDSHELKLRPEIDEKKKQNEALEKKFEDAGGWGSEEGRELGTQVNVANMEQGVLETQLNSVLAEGSLIRQATTPYDELFADIVSVMETGDPKGMAIPYPKGSAEYKSRDLSGTGEVDWQNTDAHIMLNAVGRHLWQNAVQEPKFKKNPGILLRELANAIDDDTRQVIQDVNQGQYESNTAKAARLIEKIDSRLKALP
jgi:hypothetical protein